MMQRTVSPLVMDHLINSTYITVLERIRSLYVFIGNWAVARTYLTARPEVTGGVKQKTG